MSDFRVEFTKGPDFDRVIAAASKQAIKEATAPVRKVAATMKGRPYDEVRAAVAAAVRDRVPMTPEQIDLTAESIAAGKDVSFD